MRVDGRREMAEVPNKLITLLQIAKTSMKKWMDCRRQQNQQ